MASYHTHTSGDACWGLNNFMQEKCLGFLVWGCTVARGSAHTWSCGDWECRLDLWCVGVHALTSMQQVGTVLKLQISRMVDKHFLFFGGTGGGCAHTQTCSWLCTPEYFLGLGDHLECRVSNPD